VEEAADTQQQAVPVVQVVEERAVIAQVEPQVQPILAVAVVAVGQVAVMVMEEQAVLVWSSSLRPAPQHLPQDRPQ
jgi:hypothetical protein